MHPHTCHSRPGRRIAILARHPYAAVPAGDWVRIERLAAAAAVLKRL